MASEPAIVTMNVSLPQPLKRYVDRRVSSGIYSSASEFVREAIREKLERDRERKEARSALAAKLIDGLDSGAAVPFTKGFFEKNKAALNNRYGGGSKRS
ncbi:MAG TPA: type II toxin-antitoxin system ParD family antitoxin [Tepidisphaeraceae bacterium]|nr:type II toxin-antitoxin system ParD family antitoxin [Tepidisphaeraceae bacterium]